MLLECCLFNKIQRIELTVIYNISGWIKPELKPITASNHVGLSHVQTKSENISTKNSLYNKVHFFADVVVVVVDSEAWTNEMQMGAATLAVVRWFCL